MLIKKKIRSLLLLVAVIAATPVQTAPMDTFKALLARMQDNAIARQLTTKRVAALVGVTAAGVGLWWWLLKNRSSAQTQPSHVPGAANGQLAKQPLTPNQPLSHQVSPSRGLTAVFGQNLSAAESLNQPTPTTSPSASSSEGRGVEEEKEKVVSPGIKFGVAFRQGSIGKPMEDRYAIDEDDPKFNFYAIYDGHGKSGNPLGGGFFAEILANGHGEMPSLITLIKNNLKEKNDIEQACIQAFVEMDEYLKTFENENIVGSTATVAIVNKEDHSIHFALVGDSRAVVLDKDGNVLDATVDNEIIGEERARIEGAIAKLKTPHEGAKISDDKNGVRFVGLPMSRSFGDFLVKDIAPGGVIVKPVVKHVKDGKAAYIILASDGVWDEISNENAYQTMLNRLDPKEENEKQEILTGWSGWYFFPPNYDEVYRSSENETIDSDGSNAVLKEYAQNLRDKAFYLASKKVRDKMQAGELHHAPGLIISDNIAVIVISLPQTPVGQKSGSSSEMQTSVQEHKSLPVAAPFFVEKSVRSWQELPGILQDVQNNHGLDLSKTAVALDYDGTLVHDVYSLSNGKKLNLLLYEYYGVKPELFKAMDIEYRDGKRQGPRDLFAYFILRKYYSPEEYQAFYQAKRDGLPSEYMENENEMKETISKLVKKAAFVGICSRSEYTPNRAMKIDELNIEASKNHWCQAGRSKFISFNECIRNQKEEGGLPEEVNTYILIDNDQRNIKSFVEEAQKKNINALGVYYTRVDDMVTADALREEINRLIPEGTKSEIGASGGKE